MKKMNFYSTMLMLSMVLFANAFLYSQMPAAITVEPANATVYDEITLTFDPEEACSEVASLVGFPYVAMHSGVTVNGSPWQNVIGFDGTGANGQSPILNTNGDGTYSIVFIPFEFYGFSTGATVTQICGVFNNGNDWNNDGRDFEPGGALCIDFFIPILSGTPPGAALNSIVPNQGDQGESLSVNIFGINTHFQNAATTTWLSYSGETIDFSSIYAVNDTLISAQLDIPGNAMPGNWDVNVENPEDGLMILAMGFQVVDTSSALPFSITIDPPYASAYDELTLTLDAKLSCPYGGLFDADSVMMHSGITIDGTGWSNVISFDGLGANGQSPKLTYNGDTTWSITFIPSAFYGITSGTYVEGINCVFNGGDWSLGEAKDFDPQGDCTDYLIPLAYATGINRSISNSVQIYPNPANDMIGIISDQKIKTYYIYNVLGNEILDGIGLNKKNCRIDISTLDEGMYFISVQSDNSEAAETFKFIKK